MTTIVLSLQTEQREFPANTVEGQFVWEVVGPNALKLSTSSLTADPVSFSETDYIGITFAAGNYLAKCTKNGVSVEKSFTITPSTVMLAVPAVISVVVS